MKKSNLARIIFGATASMQSINEGLDKNNISQDDVVGLVQSHDVICIYYWLKPSKQTSDPIIHHRV